MAQLAHQFLIPKELKVQLKLAWNQKSIFNLCLYNC